MENRRRQRYQPHKQQRIRHSNMGNTESNAKGNWTDRSRNGGAAGAHRTDAKAGYQTLPHNYGSSFRRYYPQEYRQRRAAATFFRTNSMQLYFVDPHTSDQGSPIAKKWRASTQSSSASGIGVGVARPNSMSSFNSLPSCPEFQHIDAQYAQQNGSTPVHDFTRHRLTSDILEEVSPRAEEAACTSSNTVQFTPVNHRNGFAETSPGSTHSGVTQFQVEDMHVDSDNYVTRMPQSVSCNFHGAKESSSPSNRQFDSCDGSPYSRRRQTPSPIFALKHKSAHTWHQQRLSHSTSCSPCIKPGDVSRGPFKRPPIPPNSNRTAVRNILLSRPQSAMAWATPSPQHLQQGRKIATHGAAWLQQAISQAGSQLGDALRGSTQSLHTTSSGFIDRIKFRKSDNSSKAKRRRTAYASGSALSEASTIGHESMASLNSLQDGRTPWPIPWLEAIFLPEYPNKGPINESHFHIMGTIAAGSFGKVHRVCMKSQPENVFAMKVQRKSEVIGRDAVQQIKDEVSIHESVTASQFVASLYASWQSRSNLYIVLQYVLGYGDLYQLWRDIGALSEPVIRIYAAEVTLALDFIHLHGVIYRDMKMENIVLDDHGHIQVVDFGLAKWLHHGDRTHTICGTLHYMAPEIAAGQPYGHPADFWSTGVLLHVLFEGRYPFPSARDHHSLNFENYTPPANASEPLRILIKKLLTRDVDERLQSLHEMKQQQFFLDFNFDTVAERKINPFDYIPRMHRCLSCNTLSPRERFENDDSYLANNFDEQYDPFSSFDYFSEKVPTCDLTDACKEPK